MKRAGIFLALLFAGMPGAHAQSASIYQVLPADDIKLGPFFSVGECFNNGPVSVGTAASPGFAFSAGADAEFPLTRSISLSVALAYDARNIDFGLSNTSEVDYNFNYIAIRPELSFNGLLVGFGLGIPLSSGVSGPGTVGSSSNFGASVMNVLFEVRLGISFPLVRSTSGVLNFTIDGAYAFTQIASSELTPSGATETPATSFNNGPLITAEVGLQYLFDLKQH